MRSMPSATPQSVAPTMIDIATRCIVSMLEPHWRLELKEHTSRGRPASRCTVPSRVNSPKPETLPRPTSSIIESLTFGLRSRSARSTVAPASSSRVATSLPFAPRAKAERAPSTRTTLRRAGIGGPPLDAKEGG